MLAGGLFLFAASVPRSRREFASELLGLAQQALRSDPTVSMELGMGVEAGGVYASSSGRALVEGGRGSGGAARTRTWAGTPGRRGWRMGFERWAGWVAVQVMVIMMVMVGRCISSRWRWPTWMLC